MIIQKEPEASLIKSAFYQLVNLRCNITDAYLRSIEAGMNGSRSNFWLLLQNPVYTGCIRIIDGQSGTPYKVLGLHKPIVSTPTFIRVQGLFFKKQKTPDTNNKITRNLKFLLKGFISCPKCERTLTASASSGRNFSKYYYYHCNSKCKYRMKSEVVYDRFIFQLKELKPLPEYFEKFRELIYFNYDKQNKLLYLKRMKEIQSIELFTDRIHEAKNLLLDGHFEFQCKNTNFDVEVYFYAYGLRAKAINKISNDFEDEELDVKPEIDEL